MVNQLRLERPLPPCDASRSRNELSERCSDNTIATRDVAEGDVAFAGGLTFNGTFCNDVIFVVYITDIAQHMVAIGDPIERREYGGRGHRVRDRRAGEYSRRQPGQSRAAMRDVAGTARLGVPCPSVPAANVARRI